MSIAILWSMGLLACGKLGDDTGAPAEDLIIEDLGSFTTTDGYTGEVTYTVPDGAASSLVWCGEWGNDMLGALWYFDGPGGSSIYDGDAGSNTYRAEFLDDLVPVLMPITPDLPLAAGEHKANIWIDSPGGEQTVNCGVVHRVSEVGNNANVKIELVFVGGDVDAAGAPDDPDLQAALDQLRAEWESAGLIAQVSYKDFAGDAATYTVVDMSDTDYSEFNALLRTANPSDDKTVTFFMVEELSYAGSTTLGLSAGPPGAATLQGTSKSGVVVTTVDLRDAPQDVGKIMAHEGGHFLGLYHTTEKDGGTHDPISDTAKCDASNDSDSNGVVNTTECGGKGAENVMWWTLTSGTATFTSDQGWVGRRNPTAW